MSNLSDLLPAGAAAKQLTFTDSGSGIASKAPVVLNSDGTVSEVSSTTQVIGTADTAVSASVFSQNAAYDSNSNRIVVVYRDASPFYGKAVVGTPSGTSISWGTPVTFQSSSTTDIGICFDSTENKIVISYVDLGSSQDGKAIVGDVSGTSISFGSAVTFDTGTTSYSSAVYDTSNNKAVIAYKLSGSGTYAVVATVSGTSISFGTPVAFTSNNGSQIHTVFDSSANKVIITYSDNDSSGAGTAVVGTVSGTSISYGSVAVWNTGDSGYHNAAYDASADRTLICYRDDGDSQIGKGIVAQVSGTSLTYGSETNLGTTNIIPVGMAYDPDGTQVLVAYGSGNDSYKGKFRRATVSGLTVSFSEEFEYLSGTDGGYIACVYNTTDDKGVIIFKNDSASSYTQSVAVTLGTTNLTAQSFVGVADSAISASAAGSVIVQGGTVSGVTLPTNNEANALSTFESAGEAKGIVSIYNPDADRVVISYCDASNSNYLTLISGSVGSDGTITWGTNYVVTSNAYTNNYNGLCYDTANNKLVVVGMVSSVPYNVALYTVTQSGDTFSYVGGATIATGGAKPFPAFDPDTNKVLVVYRNGFATSNYYPAGVVVDCSPTTPTYGSEVVIESVNSYPPLKTTYDTTADKFICCYTQAASPYNARYSVLEISGTSFTASTPTTFSSSGFYPLPLYIPSLDKTAIAYWYYPTDPGNLRAVVASLSGTTLTFGTAVDVTTDSIYTEEGAVTYDTSQSKFVIAGAWYNTANTGADSNDGHVFFGTISGTNISFSGGFDFGGSDTVSDSNFVGATYDSTENKTVISYSTTTTSTEGKAFSVNYVSEPSSGQNWYVQTDGTFATTAGTPSVKAGINISGTSLLLNGDS